jgi:hypothetical protein
MVASEGPESALVVHLKCPPIKRYSRADQQLVSAELAAIPPTSLVHGVVADYLTVRDACRALEKRKEGGAESDPSGLK